MGVELEPTEILICILLNALRRVEELEKVPSLLFVCPGVGCRDGWLAERKTKHRNSFSVPSDQIVLPVIPELTARSINITTISLGHQTCVPGSIALSSSFMARNL